MIFDLNGSKHVNDTFGHEKGNEFIIIKEHTDPDDMKQMNERLKCLVQDYNNRSSLPLSYAAGYEVSYRNHYFMINDLIQAADKNMYQDKFYKKMCISKSKLPASSQPASVIP